jgi:2-aminobenzoate-CoA ligase
MPRIDCIDTFAEDNLPPPAQMPDFRFTLPELQYPERLNAVAELLDARVTGGHGARPCLIGADGTVWSYAEVQERVDRIARVLADELGVIRGHRVLLRAPNSPMLAVAWLAVVKLGAIAVATMPMLRAKELTYIVHKAQVRLALCDRRLADEIERTRAAEPMLRRIVYWGGREADGLEAMMARAAPGFPTGRTLARDVCLIAFTSGTTGEPKGTMHFHRDLLATCDSYGRHVLQARADDRFIASPPLAFTFGLGVLLLFPLKVGASTVLVEKTSPLDLLAAVRQHRPTVITTAPTAYRAMLGSLQPGDTASLRICISAGEALPLATWQSWHDATGLKIQDGIGATEMLHIFISARVDEIRPGATGKPVPGYEAKVIDAEGREVPAGTPGRLAVRGPTGCRYLADARQAKYVERGWNLTGDTYRRDADGYFWYEARSDDMIVSAGYNIAGPEVESALLTHPAVAECGVVGAPDLERGMIVAAYVVLRPGIAPSPGLVRELQEHVKREIAPYKYPRAIEFVERLPRTETGKLKRFELRALAQANPVRRAS